MIFVIKFVYRLGLTVSYRVIASASTEIGLLLDAPKHCAYSSISFISVLTLVHLSPISLFLKMYQYYAFSSTSNSTLCLFFYSRLHFAHCCTSTNTVPSLYLTALCLLPCIEKQYAYSSTFTNIIPTLYLTTLCLLLASRNTMPIPPHPSTPYLHHI